MAIITFPNLVKLAGDEDTIAPFLLSLSGPEYQDLKLKCHDIDESLNTAVFYFHLAPRNKIQM